MDRKKFKQKELNLIKYFREYKRQEYKDNEEFKYFT
jgi:hypothetical protein